MALDFKPPTRDVYHLDHARSVFDLVDKRHCRPYHPVVVSSNAHNPQVCMGTKVFYCMFLRL